MRNLIDPNEFLSPTADRSGRAGLVPPPLAGQTNFVMSADGWSRGGGLVAQIQKQRTTLGHGRTINFAMPADLDVVRIGGLYRASITAKSRRPTSVTARYYFSPTGSDSNDGLTAATPKLNMSNFITTLSAAAPTGWIEFVLAPGGYSATTSFNCQGVNFDLSVVCENGYAYVASGRTGSEFTLLSGSIYKRAGHAVQTVVYWGMRDAYGAPTKLVFNATSWADEAAVIAGLELGEWTSLSGACYIRLPDASVPSETTLTVTTANSTLYSLSMVINKNLYMENIRMTGHGGGVLWQSSTTNYKTATFHDVEVAGNNSTSLDCFGLVVDSGSVVADYCRADHGRKDGFNYHQGVSPVDGWALETHCAATGNGSDGASNGSTTHENIISVRLGGYYVGNYGRNVHDINFAKSLLIGCAAGKSISTTEKEDCAYVVGQDSLTDVAEMWLVDCMSLGGGADHYDYFCPAYATMHLLGNTGTERGVNIVRNSRGSILRY